MGRYTCVCATVHFIPSWKPFELQSGREAVEESQLGSSARTTVLRIFGMNQPWSDTYGMHTVYKLSGCKNNSLIKHCTYLLHLNWCLLLMSACGLADFKHINQLAYSSVSATHYELVKGAHPCSMLAEIPLRVYTPSLAT